MNTCLSDHTAGAPDSAAMWGGPLMPVWSWPQEKDPRTPDAVESLVMLVHVKDVAIQCQ